MTKVGRNDPCPCGSGLKFKRCCWHSQDAAQELEPSAPPPLRLLGSTPPPHREVPDHMTENSLAPSLAHCFEFRVRRRGRAHFAAGMVHDFTLQRHVLSASVQDSGKDHRAGVKLPGPGDAEPSVELMCSCRTSQARSACRHIYAMLLQHDADLLGDRIDAAPNSHSFDEVLVRRLRDADECAIVPVTEDRILDRRARLMAEEIDKIAEDWATPAHHRDRLGGGLDPFDEDDEDDDYNDYDPPGFDPSSERVPGPERRLQDLESRHRGGTPPHLRRATRLHYLVDSDGEDLILVLKRRSLGQTGKWGQLARFIRQDVDRLRLEAADRAILASLRGSVPAEVWSAEDRFGRGYRRARQRELDPSEPIRLDPVHAAALLPRMIATGRCFLADLDEVSEEQPLPLMMGGGDPVRFIVRSDPDADGIALVGEFRRGAEIWAVTDEDVCVFGHHHVAIREVVHDLAPIADLPLAYSLLKHGALTASADKRDVFLRRFVELPGARHLEDDALVGKTAQPLQPRLTIDDPTESRRQSLQAVIEFDYGAGDVARPAEARTHFVRGGRLRPRDFAAESEHLALLGEFDIVFEGTGILSQDGEPSDAMVPKSRIDACILALIDAGWEVFAAGLPVRRGASSSLRVSSGLDWFELEGEVDFGGVVVDLPELLALRTRKREGLVRLGDGSLGILASDWLDKWQGLLELAEAKDGVLRLRSTQAWMLDAMLADHAGKIDVDRTFEDARKALHAHATVEPCRTPRGFGTKLRGYQREGLAWLMFLHRLGLGGCLADDMGLGKTVQVLALLERLRREHKGKRRRPALVVAPRSLLDNWQREAARFCPDLTTLVFFGAKRHKDHKQSLDAGFTDYDMVLTTYGTLRRDIETLAGVRFHYAILDEAQVIKNDKVQVSKAARLIDADHRLALTGTPIENHLGEIWSIFEFLNPGMLGRSRVFKDLAGMSGAATSGAEDFLSQLNAALRPFLLRRAKAEVLTDLPEKSEQVLHVELSKVQREKYDELRGYYREAFLGRVDNGNGLGGQHMFVLEALLRLRQAACHIGLIAEEHAAAESGKFEALLPMLEELCAGGHKALIFSQFTSLLALLKPHLDTRGIRYEYLDGKTTDRQARVDHFQTDPACGLFLISLKAGGLGLNLTAADYVFLLDPWWNPAVESQAIDRTHRIGQKRKVLAYRLIAKDTVEERVAELQDEKRKLVDAVLAGGGGGLKGLTVADVTRLLQ